MKRESEYGFVPDDEPQRIPLAARVAVAFGDWPPSCDELDTGRDRPCKRPRGHDGQHSAVGCALGC